MSAERILPRVGRRRKWGWDGGPFVAYFWLVGFDCWSLGIHLCTSVPNVEIHVPFGFFRIGRNPNPIGWTWDGRGRPTPPKEWRL